MLTEFFSDRLVPHVVEQRARPNEGIRRCTRYFLTSSICFGLVFGVVAASIAVANGRHFSAAAGKSDART
jgi:hypothetical protein